MQLFDCGKVGRMITLYLHRGELVLETIQEELAKAGVKNAMLVSCVATLSKTVFHRVLTFDPSPVEEVVTICEPVELSAMQGFVIDGQPHLHLVVSTESTTYSGHLEPGSETLYLCILGFVELLDYNLTWEKNEFGLPYIAYKKDSLKRSNETISG